MSLRVRCLLCREIIDCGQSDTTILLDHVREKHPNIKIIRLSDEVSEASLVPNTIPDNNLINEDLEKPTITTTPAKTVIEKTGSQISRSPSNLADNHESSDPAPSDLGDPNLVFLRRNFRECKCAMEKPQSSKTTDFLDGADTNMAVPLQMDNSPSAASKPSFYRYLSDAKKRIAKSGRNQDQVIYEKKGLPVDPLMPTRRRSRRKMYKTSIEKWRPGTSKITCPQCGTTRTPTIRTQTQRVSRNPIGAACILTLWPFCFMPCLFSPPAQEYLHCSKCEFRFGTYDRSTGRAIASKESLREDDVDHVEITKPKPIVAEPVGENFNV